MKDISVDFSVAQLNIIKMCALEVERQQEPNPERCVVHMVEAYNYALQVMKPYYTRLGKVKEVDVITLATKIHHENRNSYRRAPVQIGGEVIGWENVEHQMQMLIEHQDSLTPGEFVKRFLDIHPFINGNGRTAFILWNLFRRDLDAPEHLPNFYGEEWV